MRIIYCPMIVDIACPEKGHVPLNTWFLSSEQAMKYAEEYLKRNGMSDTYDYYVWQNRLIEGDNQ